MGKGTLRNLLASSVCGGLQEGHGGVVVTQLLEAAIIVENTIRCLQRSKTEKTLQDFLEATSTFQTFKGMPFERFRNLQGSKSERALQEAAKGGDVDWMVAARTGLHLLLRARLAPSIRQAVLGVTAAYAQLASPSWLWVTPLPLPHSTPLRR
jgi:hypothetical protein